MSNSASAPLEAGDQATAIRSTWNLLDVVDRNSTVTLSLDYLRQVHVAGLGQYAQFRDPNPIGFDTGSVENALNIILRKCISKSDILHLNANKFYLRDTQHSRIKTIREFGTKCSTQEFTWQHEGSQGNLGSSVTVAQYQQQRKLTNCISCYLMVAVALNVCVDYRRQLRFTELPAVHIGTVSRPI